jgi:sugar/nucleoside kinase (ribokinase family)
MSEDGASVLFVGDANLDLVFSGLESPVVADREVFCSSFERALGGSTAIAANAHARLGGRTNFCGLVGDDEEGRFVASRLAEAGVDTGLLRTTREARTGVTVNLSRGQERSQVTLRGSLALEGEGTVREAVAALSVNAHLHVSGPYCMPAMSPLLGGLFRAAKATGLSTSLDTQWDPTGSWAGLGDWLPHLDWLFVNESEAASISGKAEPEEAAAYLAALTACPIIKLGSGGYFAEGRRHPAFPVAVIDTRGAGDTFAAAFLFAHLTLGEKQGTALRFAAAAAAVCCGRPGGDNAALSRATVEELLEWKT